MNLSLNPSYCENTLFDAVAELMITLDKDLRIQWANKAAADFVNQDPQALVGRHCCHVWHASEPTCEHCPSRIALQTGCSQETEMYISGGTCWNLRCYPLRSLEGVLEGVVLVGLEITQRKRTEQALRESEERFRLAMEVSRDGIWDWNPITDKDYYSPGYVGMLGYTKDEAPSDSSFWINHVHPEDKDYALQINKDCIENRRDSFEIKCRMITKLGETIWILDRGKVVSRDCQGNATRMVGTHTDITDRERAEQALQEAYEQVEQRIEERTIELTKVNEKLKDEIEIRKRAENREQRRNGILTCIATGMALDSILDRIVESIEIEDPDALCSILLVDGEGKRLLHGSAPNLPDFYNQAIHGIQIGPGAGSCGTAAHEGQLVIVEDVMRHPFWSDFRDLAYRAGLRACWSKPVFSSRGAVIATFAIYYGEPKSPSNEDIERINIAANLAGLAIEGKQAKVALRKSHEELELRVEKRTVELERANEQLKQEIAEHKQTQEDLRYQQSLLETIINGTWDVLAIQHPDHTIERYNQAGYELFGLPPEEVNGRKCYELLGRNKACSPCATHQALEAREPIRIEKYVSDWDLFFDCRSSPVFDEEGNIIRLVEHLRDISEQKRFESRIEEERDYLFRVFDSMNQYIVVESTDYRTEFLNRAAREKFGDLEGHVCYEQLDRKAPCPKCPIPRVLIHNEPIQYTLEAYGIIMEGKATQLIHPNGNISVLKVLEDVTEREQAKKALQHSENYYKAIFETSASAMFIIDPDTTIYLANSNFEELSGYRRKEIEGKKSWADFMHPDDVEWMKECHYLRRENPLAAPRQYECRLMSRNGEKKDMFLAVDMIPGTHQSIASCIEITERKQMEERLRELSIHDSLTGLYNRNFFEEEMKRLSDTRHNPLGIIICDIDGLKLVNDTLGHQTGDRMLVNTAELLQQNFRASDILARIGGDEFAILVTETSRDIVEQIVQRLRERVEDQNKNNPETPISISLGYIVSDDTTEMHTLFRKADNRMYREKIQKERSPRSAIVQALTRSMQARDFDTEGHCQRLERLSGYLARSISLSQDMMNDLFLLARFHDLGKVGIPDHILFKQGSLTDEEWSQMREHCQIGYRIASSVSELAPIADLILQHHEWWNGQGYPEGVSGPDIPLPCRILAIADAYDAMTSNRPYRTALSRHEAIQELRRCAGTQFDPGLVERFIQILDQFDSE